MEYIEQLIKDSKTLQDFGFVDELPQNLLNIIENKLLVKFYNNKLDFSENEIMELFNIFDYLNNKYFEELLYLAKYYKYKLNLDFYRQKYYDNICYHNISIFYIKGFLHSIKYFINSRLIDIHNNNDFLFFISCSHNYLDITKYLISIEDIYGKINIHNRDEYSFIRACANGYLDTVKYLISLENTHGKININSRNDEAFEQACENGHLDTIKYLISLENTHDKINIYVNEEYILNYPEIIEYLHSIEHNHQEDEM